MKPLQIITESIIRSIIDESLKNIKLLSCCDALEDYSDNLLLEVATSIEPIRKKYAPNMPIEDFYKLMDIDSTFDKTNDKMGKYWRWLLTMYRRQIIDLSNEASLAELKEYLSLYSRYSSKIVKKNIEQIKSIQELKSIVQPFIENPNQATSKSQEIKNIKINDAIKVYEDSDWVVIIPATIDAAIFYGKNTKWCTSSVKAANKFDTYNDLGNLYIFINKKNNKKYQYFFTGHELKDETNSDVKFIPGLSQGAKNFFDDIPNLEEAFSEKKDELVMEKILSLLSPKGNAAFNKLDSISYSDTGLFPVMKVDDRGREMKNFMDKDGNFLSNVWFTDMTPFTRYRKYSIVSRGYRQNILFPDGHFVFDIWTDGLFDPSEFQEHINTEDPDPIIVYYNGKKGILNKTNWDLAPYWFSSISDFNSDGIAFAFLNGHKVKVNRKGEIVE